MSISNQSVHLKNSLYEVEELRNCLQQLGAWPLAGDRYLELMSGTVWDRVATQPKDFEWIPVVTKDAIEGVDIGLQYPAFFQKLLLNYELRVNFIKKLKEVAAR